jgi:hypothetical protein
VQANIRTGIGKIEAANQPQAADRVAKVSKFVLFSRSLKPKNDALTACAPR